MKTEEPSGFVPAGLSFTCDKSCYHRNLSRNCCSSLMEAKNRKTILFIVIAGKARLVAIGHR
jgi:hypothetical protein